MNHIFYLLYNDREKCIILTFLYCVQGVTQDSCCEIKKVRNQVPDICTRLVSPLDRVSWEQTKSHDSLNINKLLAWENIRPTIDIRARK